MPAGHRVRAEAPVIDGKGAFISGIFQVFVKFCQYGRSHHAFIDDRAAGKRASIKVSAGEVGAI
jgi:hypothetical protein